MVKFAGYSLITSFTPFRSVILEKNCRLAVNLCYKNLNYSRSLSTHTNKDILHAKADMVASHYLPPWFRWVSTYPICLVSNLIL